MERYTRIFSLPNNLYAEGSLVILEAGALLKDNANNTMLAQLKFKNINPKAIKMLKVEIISKDSMGRDLEPATAYQYLDLHVCRNDSFGPQQAIALPDNSVRSFDIKILEIGLEDNSIVKGSEAKWEALPDPMKLDNSELSKQCQIAYGYDFRYEAAEFSDLWYCACGVLNRQNEKNCHKCNRPFSPLSDSDIHELTAAMEQRLADEKRQREIEEEKWRVEAAEAERVRKIREAEAAAKKKKISQIAAGIFIVIVIASTIGIYAKRIIEKANSYNSALSLMEVADYDRAIEILASLGNYKDCQELLRVATDNRELMLLEQERAQKYASAMSMLEKNPEEAKRLFEELGDYKDSAQKVTEFKKMLVEVVHTPSSGKQTSYGYKYNYDGNVITEWHDGYTLSYKYNSDGQLVSRRNSSADWAIYEIEYTNGHASQCRFAYARDTYGTIGYITVTYDENSMITQFVAEKGTESRVSSLQNHIDENGNLVSISITETYLNETKEYAIPLEHNLEYTYIMPQALTTIQLDAINTDKREVYRYQIIGGKIQLKKTTTYDEYGNPIKEIDSGHTYEYVNIYNNQQELTHRTTYENGVEISQNEYIYSDVYMNTNKLD